MIRISRKGVLCFLSCLLILFPAMFSNLMPIFGGSTGRYIMYILAIFLAACSEGICLRRWQLRMAVPWLLILAVCLLNRNGDLQHGSFSSIINMVAIIAFAVAFVSNSDRFMKNAMRVMVVCLCVQLVVGFYFWFNPSSLLSFGDRFFNLTKGSYSYSVFRSYVNAGAFMGITSHYSTSGMYMALAVILLASFVLVYRQRKRKWNIGYLVVFILFFVALILTQKRAHLLFGVTALAAMYLVGYVKGDIRRRLRQILFAVVVVIVAFVVLMQFNGFQTVIARFYYTDTMDALSTGRISNLWGPAMQEFRNHPLFGVGWRQFRYLHPMHGGTVFNDAHNIYIQFITENGIFIGGLMIFYIIATYVFSWRLLKKSKYDQNQQAYSFLMFSFGYQTFFILYGLTGNPFYDIQCFFPYVICNVITYRYRFLYRNSKLINTGASCEISAS